MGELLNNIRQKLEVDFGLTPVVATEIEFYLHGAEGLAQQEVVAAIEAECVKAGLKPAKAEAERGPNQYEVSFLPSRDLLHVVSETGRFKELMEQMNLQADFAAKPQRDKPGSGLHTHVHLEDKAGNNVFFRENEEFSPQLLNAIGGLLALMNPCMSIFAPHPESYDRFLHTVNAYLVCPTASNVPATVSWGTNNRTVAVRLPPKPARERHIEHRVSGSDADVTLTIAAVLAGIHYGLKNKCNPGQPVYGDASLSQYEKPKLAMSLEESHKHNKESAALKEYFMQL